MMRTQIVAVCLAALALSTVAHLAQGLPVTFVNTNVSSSNQSRINIAATATLSGTSLTETPQFASGGLNGNGSQSALYNQTGTNTPSTMAAQLGLFSIGFNGGGTAQAANAVGTLNNNLGIAPGVGGASGTAPADYGMLFTSAQNVVIPPIDVSGLGISGLTTLNLGTLTAINLNVALRSFAIDLHSPILGMSGGGVYPMHFDSTQVDVSLTGTADMSLTVTLKQSTFADWVATGAALIALQQGLSGQGIMITETANLFGLSYQVGIGFSTPLPANLIPNSDASTGLVEHVGSNLRLTMPIKFDFQPTTLPAPLDTLIAAHFSMTGQLVGQTAFLAVPEPSSVVLVLVGLAGLAGPATLRRRRQLSRGGTGAK